MNNDVNELLSKAKLLLKDEMTGISFDTWIKTLSIQSISNDTITFIADSDFQADAVNKRYHDLIVNTFKFLTNKVYNLAVISRETANKDSSSNSNNKDYKLSKNNLNPDFTFENYVVGENNRFATAASLAVAEAPGTSYNPLLLYGGAGLGKTHLMYAIGNEILSLNSDKSVLYVTTEKFTNDFINSIQANTNEQFRNKYRNIDVLLIDDIQFLAQKERVQEEFFYTFNTILENGGQIVMTCDKPPIEMNYLEERLVSRFSTGLSADISKADYETRLAILRKKVQSDNIVIDDLILSNIASKVDSNIRDLEGTLKKVVAKASLMHNPITTELAEQCINEFISQKEKVISSDYIKETVSKYFNIDLRDINSSKRSNDIAYPRQIAMYLCRDLANMPYKKIGEEFGKRDHTTVMHACIKIEQELKQKGSNNTKLIVESVKKILLSQN